MFGGSGASRTCRWPRRPASSCGYLPTVLDQADEDVFQARLLGVEILEANAGVPHCREQRRDPGALGLGVEFIGERGAAVAEARRPVSQARGHLAERLCKLEVQDLA